MQEFSPSGGFIASFGSAGYGAGQLRGPKGAAVAPSGYVFIADAGNNRIEEWAAPKSAGEAPTYATSFGPAGETLAGRFAEA